MFKQTAAKSLPIAAIKLTFHLAKGLIDSTRATTAGHLPPPVSVFAAEMPVASSHLDVKFVAFLGSIFSGRHLR
jgi:hypothetical protein